MRLAGMLFGVLSLVPAYPWQVHPWNIPQGNVPNQGWVIQDETGRQLGTVQPAPAWEFPAGGWDIETDDDDGEDE